MMRRDFLETILGATGALAGARGSATWKVPETMRQTEQANEWRRWFPALDQLVNGRPLAYLDTAATSLRAEPVIDALVQFHFRDNANPGGALHTLAQRANTAYEGARKTVAEFIGAGDAGEVVFTRGTTEGLNLVASAWGGANLKPGDEILVGIAEHASNMAPWQAIAARTGGTMRYFEIDDAGRPLLDDFGARIGPRTRIVAFSHVSNVLGMVNPVKRMCEMAKGSNRIVVIDGAQSVPHLPVDVRDLGCDFMAFSSHKMLGPMGVGVLWGRRDLLEAMPPYQLGSNMAHDLDTDSLHLSEGALKFGAGTPNAAGAVGLAAAMRLLRSIGHDALWRHEQEISRRMLERLAAIREVRLLGSSSVSEKIAVFSFVVAGHQPIGILRRLDAEGIAIRAGDLAALPLLKRMGTQRAARASCYLYTTSDEIDRFADVLESVVAGGK